jgi:hypothetical protein
MESLNLEQRKGFIADLELDEPSLNLFMRAELLASQAGFVALGSLVSFVAGVSEENQADVLNSTLLAQLAANKKFDRENDTENWYKFYRDVLENIGWVIQGFDFDKFSTSGGDFTVDRVVLDILAAIATSDELSTVLATINALRSLSDGDDRLVLFESSSHSSQKGNFQVAPVSEIGGLLTMKLSAFYFSTSQSVDRVLFFRYSSASANLYKGSQVINLNKDVYDQVRTDIVKKLGSKAKAFVRNLEI